MLEKVSIDKVKSDAEKACGTGEFRCSEAVVDSIRVNIDPGMPMEMVSAASGFAVGVGGSKCMCGAVSGAVICLGYFFGRIHPTTITDPKSQKCMTLAHELQESFRKSHKVLCCHVHVKGMDMASGERKGRCAGFAGEMAAKSAEIVAREFNLEVVGWGRENEK